MTAHLRWVQVAYLPHRPPLKTQQMLPTQVLPPDAPLYAVGQESSQQHGGDNLLMNMELGGVSTWHKTSSGGPPAPGQTDEVEGGGAGGLDAAGSSEDQQLAPRYTLRSVRSGTNHVCMSISAGMSGWCISFFWLE